MELKTCKYLVKQIDGDYAMLQNLEKPEEEWKQVARVMLPEEITEGMKLKYELLQYSVMEESIR